ncbi:MAG: hypothetical protein ACI8UP_004073, partial [Porticoccaceae bacterium]
MDPVLGVLRDAFVSCGSGRCLLFLDIFLDLMMRIALKC